MGSPAASNTRMRSSARPTALVDVAEDDAAERVRRREGVTSTPVSAGSGGRSRPGMGARPPPADFGRQLVERDAVVHRPAHGRSAAADVDFDVMVRDALEADIDEVPHRRVVNGAMVTNTPTGRLAVQL